MPLLRKLGRLAWVTLALAAGGCRRHGHAAQAARIERDAALGDVATRDTQAARGRQGPSLPELGEELAFARAVLDGRDETKAPAHARRVAPRRVFLTAFREGAPPEVATALGDSLADALGSAARELRGRAPGASNASRARLALDVVIARSEATAEPTLGEPGVAVALHRFASARAFAACGQVAKWLS